MPSWPSTPVSVSARRAQHVVRERHGVDAEVQQRAARELGRVEPVRGVEREELAVVGRHVDDLTDLTARDHSAQRRDVRQEPRPHGLHDEHARGPGGVEDLARLGLVARERLLDQDVLARGDGQQRVVAVVRVGRGDVHDVDLRVLDELCVVGVGRVDAVLGREALGADAVARPHRHDAGARVVAHGLGERPGDVPGAQDPPADGRRGPGIGHDAGDHLGEVGSGRGEVRQGGGLQVGRCRGAGVVAHGFTLTPWERGHGSLPEVWSCGAQARRRRARGCARSNPAISSVPAVRTTATPFSALGTRRPAPAPGAPTHSPGYTTPS